jgi:hypothetical protein
MNDEIQKGLEALSLSQIELYIHEAKWIIMQLESIEKGEYEKQRHVEEQVFALYDALILERAYRSYLNLQAEIRDRSKLEILQFLERFHEKEEEE